MKKIVVMENPPRSYPRIKRNGTYLCLGYITQTSRIHPHVFFSSSAKHQGIALNDVLLKEPDTPNSLQGVIMRFRKENKLQSQ